MKKLMMLTTLAAVALLPGFLVAAATPGNVVQIPGGEVRDAFAKGRALIETETYKVHASRREAAGQAEIHTLDTDIFYVLEGSAELVVGGVLENPLEIAPREIRGSAISGGETRRIDAGDVVIVPNGVPHWFREVAGPVTYYVVKVTAQP